MEPNPKTMDMDQYFQEQCKEAEHVLKVIIPEKVSQLTDLWNYYDERGLFQPTTEQEKPASDNNSAKKTEKQASGNDIGTRGNKKKSRRSKENAEDEPESQPTTEEEKPTPDSSNAKETQKQASDSNSAKKPEKQASGNGSVNESGTRGSKRKSRRSKENTEDEPESKKKKKTEKTPSSEPEQDNSKDSSESPADGDTKSDETAEKNKFVMDQVDRSGVVIELEDFLKTHLKEGILIATKMKQWIHLITPGYFDNSVAEGTFKAIMASIQQLHSLCTTMLISMLTFNSKRATAVREAFSKPRIYDSQHFLQLNDELYGFNLHAEMLHLRSFYAVLYARLSKNIPKLLNMCKYNDVLVPY